MKKIFLTLMVMVAAVAANAQVWVGGSLGFRTFDADEQVNKKQMSFNINPEVGYDLSEDWSIAIAVGFGMTTYDADNVDNDITVSVNPYARYNVIKAGNFKFFLDGGFKFESIDKNEKEKENNWNIGIKPGVAYSLNENFSIVGHLGDGLIYRGGDNKAENGFALDVANGLSFGVYYAF